MFIPDYSSTSGLIGDSGKRLPVRQFIKTIFHIASYCIGTRAIKKLGECPKFFSRMAFAQWFYAPTGRKVIAQGKAKRRPGIRYATIFASPERAEPAARQSMRTCFALSGLWRIGSSAYPRAIAYHPGWRFALPWAISLCPVGANDPVTKRGDCPRVLSARFVSFALGVHFAKRWIFPIANAISPSV